MKIGDLITDGYRMFIVIDLQSYNGYEESLLIIRRTDTGDTEYSTSKSLFTVVEVNNGDR